MAVVIFGVTMVLAELQTKRIVDPINRLDPKNPQAEQVYDELAPLVRRLEKQKETIREQMENPPGKPGRVYCNYRKYAGRLYCCRQQSRCDFL